MSGLDNIIKVVRFCIHFQSISQQILLTNWTWSKNDSNISNPMTGRMQLVTENAKDYKMNRPGEQKPCFFFRQVELRISIVHLGGDVPQI